MTNLLKTILLASALALPITTIAPLAWESPAEAQTQKKKVKTVKKAKVTKGKKAKKVAKAKKAKKVAKATCGPNMYMKGGKCLDARAKK